MKTEFVSEPKLKIEGNGTNKYDWMKQYQTPNIKQGVGTDIKYYEGNDYFKSSVSWQAPVKGSGLNYRVYQQEIDLNLRPHSNGYTNADLMAEGKAPYILKNGVPERIQLHHSRQDGRGSLFELSEPTHLFNTNQNGKRALHPYGQNKHPSYPVDRNIFSKDQSQYWIDRLNDLKGK